MDHGVDGGGLERIATDEKRMEGEDFTKALRFDVARGHLPHRSVGAKADQVRGNSKHVGEGGEGLIGKFDEGFLEDGVGFSYKTAVALEVVGKVLANLGLHFRLVTCVLKGLAVVPSDPVERFAGNDFDVIGSFFSRESKQLIEEERGSQDSGPRIVGESFVTKNGGSTPRLFESFEESDIVATGLEASGGGETSEARADDDCGGTCGCDHGKYATRVRRRMRSRLDRERRTKC